MHMASASPIAPLEKIVANLYGEYIKKMLPARDANVGNILPRNININNPDKGIVNAKTAL